MNIFQRVFALLGMFMISITVMAEVPTTGLTVIYTPPNINHSCTNAANELELSRCLEGLYLSNDHYLKNLEKDINNELESDQRESFQAMSREWEKFVQTSCEFDSSGASGNSSDEIYSHCRYDYSLARIRSLERFKYCKTTGACGEPVRLHLIVSPITYD